MLSDYEKNDPRFTDTSQTHANCHSCNACGFGNDAYEGDGHFGEVVEITPIDPPVPTHRTRKQGKALVMKKLGLS